MKGLDVCSRSKRTWTRPWPRTPKPRPYAVHCKLRRSQRSSSRPSYQPSRPGARPSIPAVPSPIRTPLETLLFSWRSRSQHPHPRRRQRDQRRPRQTPNHLRFKLITSERPVIARPIDHGAEHSHRDVSTWRHPWGTACDVVLICNNNNVVIILQ